MLTPTTIPSDSSVWQLLPVTPSAEKLEKLERSAQHFFALLEPLLQECKERGLSALRVTKPPVLQNGTESAEANAWNGACAKRIVELAQTAGFAKSCVVQREGSKWVSKPSTSERALRYPHLFTGVAQADSRCTRYELMLIDEAPNTEALEADIAQWTARSVTKMHDLVKQLEQENEDYVCVFADRDTLQLPTTTDAAVGTILDQGFAGEVIKRMSEQLRAEWQDRPDLAWEAKLTGFAIAYFPKGTSGAQRMEMRAGNWEHFEQLPKKIDLDRCLYCA